jgi:hypothetical protein
MRLHDKILADTRLTGIYVIEVLMSRGGAAIKLILVVSIISDVRKKAAALALYMIQNISLVVMEIKRKISGLASDPSTTESQFGLICASV